MRKRIVLPEGDELAPLKLQHFVRSGIAECVVGRSDVARAAEAQGVQLGKGITIINPADGVKIMWLV